MTLVKNEIFLPGEWTSGKEVRDQNVSAAVNLASIVKTTLGPFGLDKMLIDDIGEITVTNDGATILGKLDVVHPAAKVLVELSNLYDKEIGDGTTSVVIVAAELLSNANRIIGKNMHSTVVMSGFYLALKKSLNYIEKRLQFPITDLTHEDLKNVAKTSMSSKIIGLYGDYFAEIVVRAVKTVKREEFGKLVYPTSQIGVVKAFGGSYQESQALNGFALYNSRASQYMPSEVTTAKIALLDFNLYYQRLAIGTYILITEADKIEGVRELENDVSRRHIELLVAAGANVIFTTGGIDDMAYKYLVNAGVFGVRRIAIEDMQKIQKIIGGEIVTYMIDLEGNEAFDPYMLGVATRVCERRIGEDSYVFLEASNGCENAACIVLRGPSYYLLDEVERSVHDALCAVSRALESEYVVPGGGCVEAALAVYLEEYAKTIETKEQLAVSCFAQSLLVIPRYLAINSACDVVQLISELKAAHFKAILKETSYEEKDILKWTGLDLKAGYVRNNLKAGVLEPAISKIKSLSFAVEAAVTILRIDDNIILNQYKEEGGQ